MQLCTYVHYGSAACNTGSASSDACKSANAHFHRASEETPNIFVFPSCGLPPSLPPSHPPSSEHIRESIKIPLLPLMISSLSCKRFFLPYKSPQLTWAAFCIFLTLPNTVFHVLRKLARLRIKQGRQSSQSIARKAANYSVLEEHRLRDVQKGSKDACKVCRAGQNIIPRF